MRYLIALALFWSTLSDATPEFCESYLRSKPIHALISDITRRSLDEKISVKIRFDGEGQSLKNTDFIGMWEIWAKRYPVEVKTNSAVSESVGEFEVSGYGRNIAHALLEFNSNTLGAMSWLVTEKADKRQAILDGSNFSDAEVLKRLLLTPIYRLYLNRRAKASLLNGDIFFVGDLVSRSAGQIRRIPSMGEKSLREVENTLANLQLWLGMHVAEWPPENMTTFTQKLGHRPELGSLEVSDWEGLTVDELGNLFDSSTTGLSDEYPKRRVGRVGNKPVFVLMRMDYFVNTNPRELTRSVVSDDKYYHRHASELFKRFRTWQEEQSSLTTYMATAFVDTQAKNLFQKAASLQRPFIVMPPENLRDEKSLIVLPLP